MLEWLKDVLGDSYTEEMDKKISDQIGKDFVARSDFNATNEAKKQLESQIKERDKQLSELKKLDAESLQAKVTELETANAEAKKQADAAIAKLKMDYAVETALSKANVMQNKAVIPFLDLDAVKLSEDGTLTGLSEQLEKLKTSEDTKFLFRQEEKPQVKGAQPGQARDGLPGGAPDFSKMTYEQVEAYYAENPQG
ncbi:phage scaffolding protein [Zhenpiania hominis]|uniref:Phage scaffolding protein n=1 Tax=Zhenpiania hominis TaxID=2763644 RepID=A0A923NQV7_9FIRM|nr:phage scaffolding protein [Zhenpiania hominis]MBC6681424.1 phage scaffolding protein [Zhenpiania hominis]